MNAYRVIKYLVEGDVGLSSRAIINQYIDRDHNTNINHPHDCDDLKRCIAAINSLDLYNVNHMRKVSSQWRNISNNWDALVRALSTDKNECYSLLRECID